MVRFMLQSFKTHLLCRVDPGMLETVLHLAIHTLTVTVPVTHPGITHAPLGHLIPTLLTHSLVIVAVRVTTQLQGQLSQSSKQRVQ